MTRSLARRPLGFLSAWLTECPGPAIEHVDRSKGPGEPFAFDDRRLTRSLVMASFLVAGKLLQDAEGHEEASDEMEPKKFR